MIVFHPDENLHRNGSSETRVDFAVRQGDGSLRQCCALFKGGKAEVDTGEGEYLIEQGFLLSFETGDGSAKAHAELDELLLGAIDKQIIVKDGRKFMYGDTSLGDSKGKVIDTMAADAELVRQLQAKVNPPVITDD